MLNSPAGPDPPVLQVDRLTKRYRSGERLLTVVDDITFSLGPGETCSVLGPSGSGKTTLLGLCAGLDRPTSGSVLLNGQNLGDLDQDRARSLTASLEAAYEGGETGSPDDAAVQVLCAGADDCQLKMELVHYFLTRRYKL